MRNGKNISREKRKEIIKLMFHFFTHLYVNVIQQKTVHLSKIIDSVW